MVQMLLRTPGIGLPDFAQAEAHSRRFPLMSPVLLPRGIVDLARDLPATDLRLVAPTATLLARDSLHPAIERTLPQPHPQALPLAPGRAPPAHRGLAPFLRLQTMTGCQQAAVGLMPHGLTSEKLSPRSSTAPASRRQASAAPARARVRKGDDRGWASR
jgi:hypothetical protein